MVGQSSSSWQHSNQDINWEQSTLYIWEIAYIFKISKSRIENHLHQLGYVYHFDVWIPHKLQKQTAKKPFLAHRGFSTEP